MQNTGSGEAAVAPGKRTLTESLGSGPAVATGTSYDDMLASLRAAQPLTEQALQGDPVARARVFALLAPIEARMSQLNAHQGALAQFGAGNIAGQAALDLAETAVRTWRQRLSLGTIVRSDELILRFRAGAEPIKFLTGEAKDAPTLREFNRVSGMVGAGAAAPIVTPAVIALAVEEAPLLAFAARAGASRISLWAVSNPAAALAASEALLGYGVQIGEGGWESFWAPLDDPKGRWLFLLQVLMDYMHVQSALHPDPATSEPPPEARARLANIRRILQQVDEEAYSSTSLTKSPAAELPGGARKPRPSVGRADPDNPYEHVKQRQGNWCGAACGEMSARRLGVEIDQSALAATPHFTPAFTPTNGDPIPGGFQTPELLAALQEVAHVPGRQWVGGQLPQDLSTPEGLRTHLGGYLASTQASIILRVKGTEHWIVIDSMTPSGEFMIRDPGERTSTIITAEQLSAQNPKGDAVLSFPEKKQ